jgi:DeoR family transcriptional regulator, fructose operon transcriptional repressor
MTTEQRRGKIIELLEQHGSVQVETLSQLFTVSLVTIRKDLSELEARGLLHRTHGGATWAHRSLFNPSFREKVHLQQAQKAAIATAALEFIEEGDSLILDAGSTTLTLARAMKKRFRHLHVITNAVPIALELAETTWEILLLGGTVRHHSMALIGPATLRALKSYHADKAFLSATGVSVERGYTTPNDLEALCKRAMLEAADTGIGVVDSSKLGTSTLASFAALEDVPRLVTDWGVTDELLEVFAAKRLEVTVARLGPGGEAELEP